MELTEVEKKERIVAVLIKRASKSQTIGYQELSDEASLKLNMGNPDHRVQIGILLDDVSKCEFQAQRPLLSAIVVRTNKFPGDGFYKLCEKLELGDWRKLKKDDLFFCDRIKECFTYYSKSKKKE